MLKTKNKIIFILCVGLSLKPIHHNKVPTRRMRKSFYIEYNVVEWLSNHSTPAILNTELGLPCATVRIYRHRAPRLVTSHSPIIFYVREDSHDSRSDGKTRQIGETQGKFNRAVPYVSTTSVGIMIELVENGYPTNSYHKVFLAIHFVACLCPLSQGLPHHSFCCVSMSDTTRPFILLHVYIEHSNTLKSNW